MGLTGYPLLLGNMIPKQAANYWVSKDAHLPTSMRLQPADDVENGEALLEGEEVPVEGEETEQWVECDRCKLWRVVPDAHWQDVQADKRSSWLCEYAQWDLEGWPPHKPACSQE